MRKIVSAGCLCIDLMPEFGFTPDSTAEIFVPGSLVRMEGMRFATGGSVGNTGVALSKLGCDVSLVGQVGEDLLGGLLLERLKDAGCDTSAVKVNPALPTSYSVVLAPAGIDRIILHSSAANDTFDLSCIDFSALKGAELFHLGYPTSMRSLAADNGKATRDILMTARAEGMITSLDFSYPNDELRACDWPSIIRNILPAADLVFPSIEEALMMLRPDLYAKLRAESDDVLPLVTPEILADIADELIGFGAACVSLKCGSRGFYVKTASKARLAQVPGMTDERASVWSDRECFSPTYRVDRVVNACGAGDTSIAGFLAAFLRGATPEGCADFACAVGAVCVAAPSATEGIISYEAIREKIDGGWEKRALDGSFSRFVNIAKI
ncbi:MAG: PfkB family carbohydrate kinase [Clostridia bacterium]|nr:PfkB family carbohydrate kinase [Clostridia bacterium]